MTLAMMMNQFNWSQDANLRAWIRDNRLDGPNQLPVLIKMILKKWTL